MDVTQEAGGWVAWDDATLIIGFGETRQSAVVDYRVNCLECWPTFGQRCQHCARRWI